jgi:heme exporter protein B
MLEIVKYLIRAEFKKGINLFTNLLYVGLFVFFISMLFNTIIGSKEALEIWDSVLWIAGMYTISLSISTNKSDSQLYQYYHTLFPARSFAIAKLITNTIISMVFLTLNFWIIDFSWSLDLNQYLGVYIALFIGSLAFSSIFTLFGLMNSQSNNSGALIYIMTLPIMLPMLLLLKDLTSYAYQDMLPINYWNQILVVLSLSLLLCALTTLLFPFVWRR